MVRLPVAAAARREQDQRLAYAAGFDYHVTTPAEPDTLESLIASAVERRQPARIHVVYIDVTHG